MFTHVTQQLDLDSCSFMLIHVTQQLVMKRLLIALLAFATITAFAASQKLVIAMLPKAKGNAYFLSCKAGADKAAKELGVELLFDGPTDTNPSKQNEIVENWITLGV